MLALLWTLKSFKKTALFFPSVIGLLIVVRLAALPKMFSPKVRVRVRVRVQRCSLLFRRHVGYILAVYFLVAEKKTIFWSIFSRGPEGGVETRDSDKSRRWFCSRRGEQQSVNHESRGKYQTSIWDEWYIDWSLLLSR